MRVWNGNTTNVQRRIMWIRALQWQETIRRHFTGFDPVIPLPCLLCFSSCHFRLLGLLIRLNQSRLMIIVVPFQQFLTYRYELTQRALHLLVLLRMINSDMQLKTHCLDSTVVAVLAFIRLLSGVSQRVLSHDTRVSRIERTHFAFQWLFSCMEKDKVQSQLAVDVK